MPELEFTMCYSAQVKAAYQKYVRMFGAKMSIKEFDALFTRRENEPDLNMQIPKELELSFLHPTNDGEQRIKDMIDRHTAADVLQVEQGFFEQRTRLVEAERDIKEREAAGRKVTKHLLNEVRVSNNKIAQHQKWLADLRRTDVRPDDGRIWPQWYSPVMVIEDGELVVMPMRFLCRPWGKPPSVDVEYPGIYNARRDNLDGWMWRGTFGYRHGVIIASKFFENVPRHKYEHRELREGEKPSNMVLEFSPDGLDEMYIACLWSRWQAPGQPDLLSFAVVTDEPPPEVAAAGHDRCPVPLKRENIDAWLRPDRSNLAAQYAILDDRERPYYEHRLAA